jgi:hypothetical protein
MAPKKKASGNASNGEKIFKNLCSACHSLSVRIIRSLFILLRQILLDLPSEQLQAQTSLLLKDLTTQVLSLLKPLLSGLTPILTNG